MNEDRYECGVMTTKKFLWVFSGMADFMMTGDMANSIERIALDPIGKFETISLKGGELLNGFSIVTFPVNNKIMILSGESQDAFQFDPVKNCVVAFDAGPTYSDQFS